MAAESVLMPPASASRVRSAEAIRSSWRAPLLRAVVSGWDMRRSCSGAGGLDSTRWRAWDDGKAAVNGALTISVLASLTNGRAGRGAPRGSWSWLVDFGAI